MPAKNRLKTYTANGYYHLYNRGVNKQAIFLDQQDYNVFLDYLSAYLTPLDRGQLLEQLHHLTTPAKVKDKLIKQLRLNNFANQVDLLAFCLMPNHFHLLIKQKTPRAIEAFMKSLGTRYVQYFNHRHNFRRGPLFEDIYKAVPVISANQLLHLTRYIHRNPYSAEIPLRQSLQPSSYPNYLGLVDQPWVKPHEVLAYFSNNELGGYEAFVADSSGYSASLSTIAEQLIDP